MTVYFMVRAQLAHGVAKDEFDRWYREEHLPDALKAFQAQRAWRGWSELEPRVHYAFYEFDDPARARSVPGSEALQRLAAEFDRVWGDRVIRSRDIVQTAQHVGP